MRHKSTMNALHFYEQWQVYKQRKILTMTGFSERMNQNIVEKCSKPIYIKHKSDLNESILRTRGARGMSMNNEFVKNAILLRASRFVGTSRADSFTVNSR